MAKLNVKMDLQFKTNALLARDKESFREVTLDGAKAKELFEKIPKDELEFELVSTNKGIELSYPFSHKNGKKGAIFDVLMSESGESLEVKISGDFALTLRGGGDKQKELGDQLDLRVRGVMWKGGAYRGFMASVVGGDYSESSPEWPETFPKVVDFSVK